MGFYDNIKFFYIKRKGKRFINKYKRVEQINAVLSQVGKT